ncbi:hypothetical protein EVAR_76104_1 [Eumeta japonica]|uniref:Uncharacterized protein n=1 Tax=Eumeta variegata TaxID=151549 RepID=A0A4C1W2R9_EUMVA|nr:hypothetical protein EVAR_76104_1 [Eumeta japonica]
MLQQLADESEKAGLSMNITETKILLNSSQTNIIKANNEQIEHLGQLISTEDCMRKEIERRSRSEVVSNLSTPAFLDASKWFTLRSGLRTAIRSDCGINYVGANNHVEDLYTRLQEN